MNIPANTRLEPSVVRCLGFRGGSSDKVYALVRSGPQHFLVWGRRPKGNLQIKPVSEGSGFDQISRKLDEGYSPVQPCDVPDLQWRVECAVARV